MSTNEYHTRFKDASWYSPGLPVIVGGAGGIGSWLCLLLSRIGCEIHLYEMDTIETSNMAGQLYPINSVRSLKSDTIKKVVKEFSDNDIITYTEYTKDSFVSPVMFSAFDNMKARKLMFNKWKQQKEREVFIDGRMLMEVGQVFTVIKGRETRYEEYLFNDTEVQDQPCTLKATSHSGSLISSLMISCLNNYLFNKNKKLDIREIPFKIEYRLPLLEFNKS